MSITSSDDERNTRSDESLRERKKRYAAERLYDAALDLFAARPYTEVTVDEICARAEVGRATFFRLYGTKAGLLSEFNRRLAIRVGHAIRARPAGTAVDYLRAVQEETSRAWQATGPAMREMAREWIRNASVDELGSGAGHSEYLDHLAGLIRWGQERGELVSGHDPRFVAWVVFTTLSAATAGWLSQSGDDETLLADTHEALELLLSGLRA